MMSAGIMGKLGDKVGNHRLLVVAQVYSVFIYLLCANATSPFQLGFYRFLFGLGTGALIPGVNALLSKMTPKVGISRVFAFNQVFFLSRRSDRSLSRISSSGTIWLSLSILCNSSLCSYQLFI